MEAAIEGSCSESKRWMALNLAKGAVLDFENPLFLQKARRKPDQRGVYGYLLRQRGLKSFKFRTIGHAATFRPIIRSSQRASISQWRGHPCWCTSLLE